MFADELRKIIKSWVAQNKPGASWKELGEHFGLSTPVLFNFLNDEKKTISLDTAEKILAVIGGDMRRGLPDYDPTAEVLARIHEDLKVVRVDAPMFRGGTERRAMVERWLALKEWEREQSEATRRKAERGAELAAEMERLLRHFKGEG